MKRSVYLHLMGGVAGTMLLVAGTAHAQTGAPPVATQPDDGAQATGTNVGDPAATATTDNESTQGGLADIIVTAQRKSERLQDVPIAVNVVLGEALTARGISSSQDLPTLVPALNFSNVAGAGTAFLRGVGSNAANPNDEPSVATYIDGVYIASPYANILKLANLDRIEVLKGPQGTLFGRNATGGVIQLITRDPSLTAMSIEAAAGYSNYDTYSGSLYASVPLGESVAIDFSAQGSKQNNGWGFNSIRNQETYLSRDYGFRSKILIEPSEGFRMTLSGDYSNIVANFADYRLPRGAIGADGQPSPNNGYDTRGIITSFPGISAPEIQNKQYGFSANTSADVGFARLVTILAYRQASGYYYAEADATPLPLVEAVLPTYQQNISGEVQLVSKAESPFDWTLGAYYYDNTAGYRNLVFVVPSVPVPILATTLQKTESVSGYAQAGVELFAGFKVTGGIRYTDERQTLRGDVGLQGVLPNFGVTGTPRGYKEFTYRASADYAFTNDIHAYASYNRGVKGGGFDVLSVFNALGGAPTAGFDPEFINAYEVGLKSKLLDNTLRFNISAFYYDYSNIQVQVIPAGSTSAGVVVTTNAAAATIKGIDVDFEYQPVRAFNISGGFAVIDGQYDDFQNTISYGNSAFQVTPNYDASGNPTVRTPKFTGNLTGTYTIDSSVGTFPISTTVSHNSGFSFGSDNVLRNEAYTLVNASIGWTSPDKRYGVSVWGKNLTDTYYLSQGVPSALGSLTTPAAPRTYGATLKVRFGG